MVRDDTCKRAILPEYLSKKSFSPQRTQKDAKGDKEKHPIV